jgi:hypothetical protein
MVDLNEPFCLSVSHHSSSSSSIQCCPKFISVQSQAIVQSLSEFSSVRLQFIVQSNSMFSPITIHSPIIVRVQFSPITVHHPVQFNVVQSSSQSIVQVHNPPHNNQPLEKLIEDFCIEKISLLIICIVLNGRSTRKDQAFTDR